MPYPFTASISTTLRTPKDRCLKVQEDRSHYVKGFIKQTFPSATAFIEAISSDETHNGAGFSFGDFKGNYRHSKNLEASHGIGIDFDKITRKGAQFKEILWDECEKVLPTEQELLNSRIGPFIRAIYRSQSCPDGAEYIMGRAVLSFGRPLTHTEHQAAALCIRDMLYEDIPKLNRETLEGRDLEGGLDEGAVKDPVRWWAGIKHGRSSCYISEDAPPIPVGLLDDWVGKGTRSIKVYEGERKFTDTITLDPLLIKMFDVIIRDVLTPSGYNTYEKVLCWVKAFTQQTSPALDDAFVEWIERSPYRLQQLNGASPEQFLHTGSPMSFSSIRTMMRAIERDRPDWISAYYEACGEYPVMTNSSDIDEEEDDIYKMQSHPGIALEALASLGL